MVLKNNKILIGFILFLFSANIMISYSQQDKPLVSSGNIQFYFDNAVFPASNGNNYVEFYLMFYSDQVTFKGNGKGELLINATISEENGNPARYNKDWSLDISYPKKEDGLKTKVIYDQWVENLKAGKYNLTLNVTDKNNRRSKGELVVPFTVEEVGSSNSIKSSQIEFISSAKEDSGSQLFRKGNISVVPNPSRRYGLLIPALNFYYELYNLDSTGNLYIKYSIQNSDGETKKIEEQQFIKPGKTAAIIRNLDIAGLKSGLYKLSIDASDSGNHSSCQLTRNFEIIDADFIKNISTLSKEEDKIYSKILSYLATPNQVDTYNKLTPKGKAQYLVQFWKSLDPTPGTPENEYLEKIQKRFVYATQNFGWSNIKGWNTDMGRVCIKYGIPDEVQQYNSESSTRPYQIWYYKENRGFEFVFGDTRSDGRYILLHSNVEGEISNSYWLESIQK